MHHIATHNIGLGSYDDDFNRLIKDLLMKDLSVKGFYTLGKTIIFKVKRAPKRERHGCHSQKYGTLSIYELNISQEKLVTV